MKSSLVKVISFCASLFVFYVRYLHTSRYMLITFPKSHSISSRTYSPLAKYTKIKLCPVRLLQPFGWTQIKLMHKCISYVVIMILFRRSVYN